MYHLSGPRGLLTVNLVGLRGGETSLDGVLSLLATADGLSLGNDKREELFLLFSPQSSCLAGGSGFTTTLAVDSDL